METAIFSLLALCVLSNDAFAQSSRVMLQRDPQVIQTILTQEMTMQCSINDTSGGDLRFVTSLVLTRNGVEVASITPFSPVHTNLDIGKVNATGSVSATNGAQGFLLLKWTYPDQNQAGNYTCEVNGVNSVGHPISYSTKVFMPVRQPTLDDITNHVSDQQKILDRHTADNKFLLQQNAKHTADLSTLKMEMLDQQQAMTAANQTAARLQGKVNTVLGLLNDSRHVMNGTVVCGDAGSWTDVGNYREVNQTTTFPKSYGKTPIVHVSPVHISNYNDNADYKYDIKYWIDLMDVNTTGFSLRCRTDGVPNTGDLRLYQFDVLWFSIGSYN